MPKGERKTYTKELKMTAVYLMQQKIMKTSEICKLLGVDDRQTVHRWMKEYENEGEAAFSENKAVLPGCEVERLREEAEQLRLENEILKKAAAYFAKKNTIGSDSQQS